MLRKDATGFSEPPIAAVVAGMQQRLDLLPARLGPQRVFLSTYQRTTEAVGARVEGVFFEDPEWVERWDVAFANLYLTALDAELADGDLEDADLEDAELADAMLPGTRLPDAALANGDRVPRPWRLAFAASPDLPPLRHVLLGINAHVNYDLPQALLAVISDEDFSDRRVMDRRRRDHERIDAVLASRVAAEDGELTATGRTTILDRLLTPLNRLGSRRFLREARQKVWHNTLELHASRLEGPQEYAVRLAELELLSAAKIADLLQPGQVLLRLAIAGFGVSLPPADT
jgi:hypothetical protein